MHYAIEVVPFGTYANPRKIAWLAQAAEDAGWEGLFVWDHLGYVLGIPGADPWVILSAAAMVTSKIRLGVEISPLARYRPHLLAQTLTSLDLLSDGRVIFGAGLGHNNEEFSLFGEQEDQKIRARMLDEGLDVLSRFMCGEAVNHQGEHYTVNNVALLPLPVQRPRIPIWIGGRSHPALRRAARWDGWVMTGAAEDGTMKRTPGELAEKVEEIYRNRSNERPFDVAISGYTQAGETSLPREFESAGATWWLECLAESRGTNDVLLERIKAGPP